MAAKEKQQELPPFDAIMKEMKGKGLEAIIPSSGRAIRLRTVDAPALLRNDKMPDILTPLVVKAVYGDVLDKEIREFISTGSKDVQDALKMAETLDFVVKLGIADNTNIQDLTLGEKRWVFRLVMGPAELLADFCYVQEPDVESVDPGNSVQPASK